MTQSEWSKVTTTIFSRILLLTLVGCIGLLLCLPLSAQTEEQVQSPVQTEQQVAVTDTVSDTETGLSFGDFLNELVAFIVGLLVLLVPLGMIVHMLYINWKTMMLKKILTVEHFTAKRVKKELPEQMTDTEINDGHRLLDTAYNELTVLEVDENGNEFRKPGKMKELLRAQRKVEEVGKLMPTDPEVLERYNQFREFLYDYLRRSFFASWKLIVLCLLVAIGISFTDHGGFWNGFFTLGALFWMPAIVYYISSQVPQYMIDKKNDRGGGNGWFSTALVALGLGVLGSGYTVRTTYSDGSTSDDHSGHWIALFLGLLVLFAVALTIYIWATINYLRNYVLYW